LPYGGQPEFSFASERQSQEKDIIEKGGGNSQAQYDREPPPSVIPLAEQKSLSTARGSARSCNLVRGFRTQTPLVDQMPSNSNAHLIDQRLSRVYGSGGPGFDSPGGAPSILAG
jgi:hypothetical protein